MAFYHIILPKSSQNRFSTYSEEDLLEQYKNKVWKELDSQSRLDLMHETIATYCKKNGIKSVPNILEERSSSLYGSYSAYSNTVYINLELCNNPYEALDTIIHETNHAYQEQCIKENTGYTQEERALLKAENGEAYQKEGLAYERQSLETDSNNAGIKILLSEQARYEKDPLFAEYMSKRVQYFGKIAADYTQNTEASRNSERLQLKKAYEECEISAEEYQYAANYLQDSKDNIKKESVKLETSIQKSFKECVMICSKDLHRRFEQCQWDGNRKAMSQVHEDITIHQKILQQCECNTKVCIDAKLQEIRQYVCANNMGRYDTERDSFYKQMVSELSVLQEEQKRYSYAIAELQTDNQLMGYDKQEFSKDYKNTIEEQKGDGLEQCSNNAQKNYITRDMDDGLDLENNYHYETVALDNSLDSGIGIE